MWPEKGSKPFNILKLIDELSRSCIEGRVPVAEVYERVGGSKESSRVIISQLKRNGLVEAPLRGMYVLTEIGRSILDAVTGVC
jgi:Mn-dependent DtxR family transcriptional regulator